MHQSDRVEELRRDLTERSADWCATKWVLEAVPFAFDDADVVAYWEWKAALARRLGVDPKNVLITGSGAVGVSLNPYKALRPFDEDSDIDVAVISTHHFDVAWRALRSLGAAYYSLTREQQTVVRNHQLRHVYWGTIATDRILPILPFARPWIDALDYMSKVEPTAGRDVNVRVYRDFAALRSYLRDGIKKVVTQAVDVAPTDVEIADE